MSNSPISQQQADEITQMTVDTRIAEMRHEQQIAQIRHEQQISKAQHEQQIAELRHKLQMEEMRIQHEQRIYDIQGRQAEELRQARRKLTIIGDIVFRFILIFFISSIVMVVGSCIMKTTVIFLYCFEAIIASFLLALLTSFVDQYVFQRKQHRKAGTLNVLNSKESPDLPYIVCSL